MPGDDLLLQRTDDPAAFTRAGLVLAYLNKRASQQAVMSYHFPRPSRLLSMA